jgi:hypothetical protein
MTSGEGKSFDPSRFIDPQSGNIDNRIEFDRQTEELLAKGDIEPLLSFIADKIAGDDPRESTLYTTILMDVMERADSPLAVLHHATNLTETNELASNYIQAATTSRIASSVYLERGQLRDAASWFTRMRSNTSKAAKRTDLDDIELAMTPVLLRGVLDYESYYLLELASKGKAKQVKRDIAQLDADPVLPAERHILASTLAFIEHNLSNHTAAMQALKKAEKIAEEVGDFADASIYASRRTTQIMMVFGRMGVKSALDTAAAYLEQAQNSDNDPELIARARDQLESRKKLFI